MNLKGGVIGMFKSLKEKISQLNKETANNINRIRSDQKHHSQNFNKEWNKWNSKTQIRRKPL